jgi:OTT_1508-like deaminase
VQHLKLRLGSSSRKIDGRKDDDKRLLRRWKKYVVHPEMLLLLFYEEHPDIHLVQDHIGISKISCFLCASFIRFHKRFNVEGEHQQLYCLWTLPEHIYLQTESQKVNLVAALTELSTLLANNVTAICQSSRYPLPYNAELVANFSRTSLLTRRKLLAQPSGRHHQHSKDSIGTKQSLILDLSTENC